MHLYKKIDILIFTGCDNISNMENNVNILCFIKHKILKSYHLL